MRWSNVLVIFRREVRDQLRDRRTLFMIFVLPMLLYPILGLGTAQLATAFQEKTRTVVVVGSEFLPENVFARVAPLTAAGAGVVLSGFAPGPPPLLTPNGDGFNPALFEIPSDAGRLRVETVPANSSWSQPDARRAGLRSGRADAVVLIPNNVGQQLRSFRRADIPIYYNSADERSQITNLRVERVLSRWYDAIVVRRLEQDAKPRTYTQPARTVPKDVATVAEAGGSVWAKLFPFLLVMMSLTGAFYPAVDLCAGEKERGTMETLLISPASRAEIVIGKFLTVMLASMATALLNLLSMGVTAMQLASQFRSVTSTATSGGPALSPLITAPSWVSAFWMVLLLVPLSIFFSALCLALAVLARSMKEGQYYMTPLYLVALPLIFLTLAPGIELNLFTSLIPITGVSLLLRSLMQGDYADARRFFLPVLVPIVVYGAIALRWAIDQFKKESVLFREAERFGLLAWLRHLIRDREPTPGGGQALLCFVLMLTSAWFLMPFLGLSLAGMAAMQVGVVLVPPLVLALLFTSDPGLTLRLRWPRARYIVLGIGLALTLFPLVNEMRVWVEYLFPTPESIKETLHALQSKIPNVGTAILLLALAPAICEEVAFRGYILSGLQRGHRALEAIILSALLFGFMHVLLSLFQQLFNATILGLFLGLLAVRSRSLLPGVIFHFLNNSLALLSGPLMGDPRWKPIADLLYRDQAQGLYHWPWVALGAVMASSLFIVLYRDRGPTPRPKPERVEEPVASSVSV